MTLEQLFTDLINTLASANVEYGQGNATAEDDVILLLMAVLNVDFETLNQMANQQVTALQKSQAYDLMTKRIELQRPMAYVVGFAIYAGLKFSVDERVLIPRSPFAELIDRGFQPHLDIQQVRQVLDLCTGSGCIGLAVAHYYPHTHVDLADLSSDALLVAENNRQQLGLSERSRVIQTDLWHNIDQKYDLIVTNPPYVGADEYAQLPAEFSHEPAMALVSPVAGLLLPVQILADAANYLTEQGCLFLEVGYSDLSLQAALAEVPFQWLEFDHGGQGICVFNRQDLIQYQPYFVAFLESHVT